MGTACRRYTPKHICSVVRIVCASFPDKALSKTKLGQRNGARLLHPWRRLFRNPPAFIVTRPEQLDGTEVLIWKILMAEFENHSSCGSLSL